VTDTSVAPFTVVAPDGPVRGLVHQPANPTGAGIVLTHGAGSNCQTPLLVALAGALASQGLTVLRCDLPFRQARPRGGPGRMDAARDRMGLLHAVDALARLAPGPIFLGGHSYGGRQASMLVAERSTPVRALLLLAYPLRPPDKLGRVAAATASPRSPSRTTHFSLISVPALFVHGTRDPFGSAQDVDAARSLIPAPTALLTLDGARHDLVARAATGTSRTIEGISAAFLAFVRDHS